MLANKFIDLLESENLLDPEMIDELRRQVSQSGNRLPVETLAKLLVDNEQLTKFQATRLVSRLKAYNADPGTSDPVDELTFADENDTAGAQYDQANPPVASIVDDEDIEEVDLVDDDEDYADDAEIVDDGYDDGYDDVVVAEVVDEATPVGRRAASGDAAPAKLQRPSRAKASAMAVKPSRWQTMRTYGAFGLLLAVATALVFLGYWFMRGSAEESLAVAKESYEARDYDKAIKRYTGFIEGFRTDDRVSFARCRIVVAKIRQVTENSGDPFAATDTAKTLLPGLMDESALSVVRPDLAGALLNIADRLVSKADNAKTNEERKTYLDGLENQLELIGNPQYVAGQERKQNEPKINSLEESRQRLLRTVRRSEDRSETAVAMQTALDSQDTQTAYQARQVLVRRYPQLQADEELSSLLANATAIVQQRIVTAKVSPTLVEADADEESAAGRRVLLNNRSGKELTLKQDQALYIKAKRSLYGIQASTGEVLWRNYLGGQEMSEPQSVGSDIDSVDGADCLLTLTHDGMVKRLAAKTGKPVWQMKFDAAVFAPQITRQSMFIADATGRVSCVNNDNGSIRWCKQVPQPISTPLGGGSSKESIYAVGDNSNLYVFSQRDGTCSSVYYLGHEQGTIAVPPIAVLDRLLVFENSRPGHCDLRILSVGDNEAGLTSQQDPMPLEGHVVVPPVVDGRRVIVLTDLGEISVFEVETISGKAELVLMSRLVASELEPRIAWPMVVNNDLFVSSIQLTKYEIQAARQLIERKWVRDDKDQFLARPIALEDYVIHVRNVRGTQGIRVTAIDRQNGNVVWETSVAVPVVGLMGNDSGVDAITSQASLYRIDKSNINSGKINGPIANPGRNQRQMDFSRTTDDISRGFVAVNSERGTQIAVYNAKSSPENSLSILSLVGDESQPSGDPVWVAAGIAIPLDNGQLLSVDPANGKRIGQPIQTQLSPGKTIRWSTPTLLQDNRTLIAANSDQQLMSISTDKQFSRLVDVKTAKLASGRLGSLEEMIFLPSVGDQSSYIEVYSAGDLTRKSTQAVDGRILWGMYDISGASLCYSNLEGLIAIDGKGEKKWTAAISDIAPVGPPIELDGAVIVATVAGDVYRIDGQSGEVTGILKTGEAISAAPLILGTGLVIPGEEGNVLAVSMSQFEAPPAE